MAPIDPIILSITEHKMRVKLDEFYIIASELKDCAYICSHIGNPFSRESVSSYMQYTNLADDLYRCYNDISDYLSVIGAHLHDQLL